MSRPHTGRAWPLATSANTVHDEGGTGLHYRPSPPPPPPPTTAAAAVAGTAAASSQSPAPTGTTPSAAPAASAAAARATSPRRATSHGRNIPFHSTTSAQRGSSQPQSSTIRTATTQSPRHVLPACAPHSTRSSSSRQPSLSVSPRADSSGHSYAYAPSVGLSGRPSSRSPPVLPDAATRPTAHGDHTRPTAPYTAGTVAAHLRYETSTRASHAPRRFPPPAAAAPHHHEHQQQHQHQQQQQQQQQQLKQPRVVYLESMDVIPQARQPPRPPPPPQQQQQQQQQGVVGLRGTTAPAATTAPATTGGRDADRGSGGSAGAVRAVLAAPDASRPDSGAVAYVPPPAPRYHMMSPSLQLAQHRHVRHIVAGDMNGDSSSQARTQPQQPQQQQRVVVLVPQPRPVPPAAPPPPPPPQGHHHVQQQQQQRGPHHPHAAHVAGMAPRHNDDDSENECSIISDVESTRSSRTRHVFRAAPSSTAGRVPAGSPYGATPTFAAAAMPRARWTAPSATHTQLRTVTSAPASAQRGSGEVGTTASHHRPAPPAAPPAAPPKQASPLRQRGHGTRPPQQQQPQHQLPPTPPPTLPPPQPLAVHLHPGASTGSVSTHGHVAHRDEELLSVVLPHALGSPPTAEEEEVPPNSLSVRTVVAAAPSPDATMPFLRLPVLTTTHNPDARVGAPRAAPPSPPTQQQQHEARGRDTAPYGESTEELSSLDSHPPPPRHSSPSRRRADDAAHKSLDERGRRTEAAVLASLVDAHRATPEQASEDAERTLPPSAPLLTDTTREATAHERTDHSTSVDGDGMRHTLTPERSAARRGRVGAVSDESESAQDIDREEMDVTDGTGARRPSSTSPSSAIGDDGTDALTEAQTARQPTGIVATATSERGSDVTAVAAAAAAAPPLRSSLERDLDAEEEAVGVSPLAVGERYGYVDPLEEASMDAAYMLDTLEQQYIRINEETKDEMEDVVHVVELQRRDRAAGLPRCFVAKGQYPDVLPLLRYPAVASTAPPAAQARHGPPRTLAGELVYMPLTEGAYVNLCATVWLSRFSSAAVQDCLAIAQGPPDVSRADDDDGGDGGSGFYMDHPSATLLDQLDQRLADYVRTAVEAACAGTDATAPRTFTTACVQLSDRDNIECLPRAVWAEAAPRRLSFADHVTDVILEATVPREAERRRRVAATVSSPAEVAARGTLSHFLGASPWTYEEAVETEVCAAMPTAAARLAYAFMYKARMRNLSGGIGSLMLSMMGDHVPEAAVMDCLLMQEKLRLALQHSCANVAACCLLRQAAVHERRVSLSQAQGRSMEESLLPSGAAAASPPPPPGEETSQAPLWSSPALSTYLSLYEGPATPLTRRTKDRTSDALRLDELVVGPSSNSPRGGAWLHHHDGSYSRDVAAASPTATTTTTAVSSPRGGGGGGGGASGAVVDLYSVAVQLNFFFPAKTERGVHQLCAALIEDLVALDALPVPEEVTTPEGVVLADRTSIVDAIVVEGAQAMRHIIMSLSAQREDAPAEAMDNYKAPNGHLDAAAATAAMERRLVAFDPAIMYFLSTPVPVDALFAYVETDGPPSMQPQATGRKSAFVEVLRLQHVAETVQYAMEMQDAILVSKQFDHLAAAAPAHDRHHNNNNNSHIIREQPEASTAGSRRAAPQSAGETGSADLLTELTAGDEPEQSRGDDVSVRAVLIALCSADADKPLADVQAYLLHLLVLYYEGHTVDGAVVDCSDPHQVAQARRATAEMAMWDWFGDTVNDGTLRAGAAAARCDEVRVVSEELASLCPRVLGRRVGSASGLVTDDAPDAYVAGDDEDDDDDDAVLVAESTQVLPRHLPTMFDREL